jgi:hypothetical protein
MQYDHEGATAVGGHRVEELTQRLYAARRRTDADDGDSAAAGRSRSSLFSALLFRADVALRAVRSIFSEKSSDILALLAEACA